MNYLYQQPLSFSRGVGVVLGSFSPLHKGHLDLIYRAKKECLGGALVVVCGYENDKGYPKMTLKERYQMVRQYFRDDPLVAVYALSDDEMGIAEYATKPGEWQWGTWLEHLCNDVIAANIGGNDDPAYMSFVKSKLVFYTGEKAYSDDLRELGCKTVLLDRTVNPVSGTMIRDNPIQCWDNIAWTYHRKFSHNILITGTASEGKTTLVEDIGRYFNLPYSYEWARGYIDKYMIGDWEFDVRDFLAFLTGQYNYNRDCLESPHNNGVFVSDTDCIVTKMYAKYYAQDEDMVLTMDEYERVIEPVADTFIKRSHWDKIFVVVPKGEFVDDHTRYMKHSSMQARKELACILLQELDKAGLNDKLEILDGGYLSNFTRVKNYITEIIERGKANAQHQDAFEK